MIKSPRSHQVERGITLIAQAVPTLEQIKEQYPLQVIMVIEFRGGRTLRVDIESVLGAHKICDIAPSKSHTQCIAIIAATGVLCCKPHEFTPNLYYLWRKEGTEFGSAFIPGTVTLHFGWASVEFHGEITLGDCPEHNTPAILNCEGEK